MNVVKMMGSAVLLLTACSQTPKEFVLTGKFANNDSVRYLLVGSGHKSVADADTVNVAVDGSFIYKCHMEQPSFGFLYAPDKAFYPLILINGAETHLDADLEAANQYKYTGDLEEAYAFQQTVDKSLQMKMEQSYPSFESLHTTFVAFEDSVKSALQAIPEEEFHDLELQSIRQSIAYASVGYAEVLKSRGEALDGDKDFNAYMESLDLDTGENTVNYLRWKGECEGRGNGISYSYLIDLAEQKITRPEVLEKTLMELMSGYFLNCDSTLDEVYSKVVRLVKKPKYREWLEKMYTANKNLIPGADAIDCTLENPEGKVSKLSDLYGKLLYLDIWATWCGPCCAEIPYMEQLAAHFKGDRRIEIVSISVDSKRNEWIDKLQADKPQWKQFLSPKFTELYGIAGIPCFILIDKNGKIITVQAPRPSEAECIPFIEKHLGK